MDVEEDMVAAVAIVLVVEDSGERLESARGTRLVCACCRVSFSGKYALSRRPAPLSRPTVTSTASAGLQQHFSLRNSCETSSFIPLSKLSDIPTLTEFGAYPRRNAWTPAAEVGNADRKPVVAHTPITCSWHLAFSSEEVQRELSARSWVERD